MNVSRRLTFLAATGLLAASTLLGCEEATKSADPQPVDHQTAHQAVVQNTERASLNVTDALNFLRHTDMLAGVIGGLDGLGSSNTCMGDDAPPAIPGDGPGENGPDTPPFPSDDCFNDDPAPVEDDIADGTDQLIDELNERIFVEANIESQTDIKITYLLHGAQFCRADDFEQPEELQDCISNVDQLQIRLVATSRAQGDVDIDVLVGPERYNPVNLELHHDLLAATVDLAQLRSTIVFGANVTDADIDDLPATMRGKVRGELTHAGAQTGLALEVLAGVSIEGSDYLLHVDKAQPAAFLSVDSAAKTAHARLNLNAVDLRLPITETTASSSDGGEMVETETTYVVDAHLGGAKLDAEYTAGNEHIDVHNAGLGNTDSTLNINGKRVLAVNLNRDHGRQLDFSVTKTEQGVEWSVGPAFDLELMFQFAQAQGVLDDIADWMLDDLIRVTLDGAPKPAVRFGDGGIEVLAGALHLSSTAAGVDETVAAGQCLLGGDDNAEANGGGMADDSDMPISDESDEQHHPFTDLSAGACQ